MGPYAACMPATGLGWEPIGSVLAAQGDPLKQSVCRWRGRAAMAATGVRGVGARRLFGHHSDHLKRRPSFVFRFP